jgi:prepilin-type N-terminal cleavage/methylation domain-containing protein
MTRGRRLAQEGFTLIEIVIVMTVSVVLLTATLGTMTDFIRGEKRSEQMNEVTEGARRGLDAQARQLRNLAKRLNNANVIDTVGPDDMIFQTSDPARTWVRYCLDTSVSTNRGQLWETASPNSNVTDNMRGGATHSCPGTGWTAQRQVADYVVNQINGRVAPTFTYSCIAGVTDCTSSATTFDQIVAVNSQLHLDTTPNARPAEFKVSTRVYLRNQNQAPVARFDSSVNTNTSRAVYLNASRTTDYEGRTLGYYWFKGTRPADADIQCDEPLPSGTTVQTLWGAVLIGTGITLNYKFPTGDASPQQITLVACDPGDRFGVDGARGVAIP